MLFYIKKAIFYLYYGENKLNINEMMIVHFVLDQHKKLDL